MRDRSQPIWVITSYYNPFGYQRRLFNYRLFRKHLGLPLVTVEWSPDGQFELAQGDAEILVQVRSGDMLWQKERLLNLALQHLPPHCRYVAWVDCDVVFDDPYWPTRATRSLDTAHVIQLFGEAAHTPPLSLDTSPDIVTLRELVPIHREISWISSHVPAAERTGLPDDMGTLPFKRRSGLISSEPQYAPGIAWAARREVLDAAGFYDANVLGGGDTAMAFATIGQAVQLAEKRPLSNAHLQHYLAWAEAFGYAAALQVAYLPGKVYHLWHGEFSNRQYKNRHLLLQVANFDPLKDIRLSEEHVWEWSDASEPLREAVRTYLCNRREDG